MNRNNEKLKMQDSLKIIQNNRTATLALCNNGMPFITTITYDSDCFCNCIKLYFETCRCGEVIDILNNNTDAAILINGNNCNNVLLEGTINILPPEVDCCCNVEDRCCVGLEFTPSSICGRRQNGCCNI